MSTIATFTELDSDEQKRLLDKLAKLKALSECPTGNANETATAAATMTRIMLEYEIEMADLAGASTSADPDVIEQQLFPEDSLNGYPIWKTTLLTALADVNHCVSYTSSATDEYLWMRQTRTRLSLIGAAQDIENTRRLFFFCVEEIERLCYIWGPREKVKRKNDYKRGAARGIAHKVREERDRVMHEQQERARSGDGTSFALELFGRKEQAVSRFAADLGLRTYTKRARGVQPDAYSAGYDAGCNLDLSRGSRAQLTSGRR